MCRVVLQAPAVLGSWHTSLQGGSFLYDPPTRGRTGLRERGDRGPLVVCEIALMRQPRKTGQPYHERCHAIPDLGSHDVVRNIAFVQERVKPLPLWVEDEHPVLVAIDDGICFIPPCDVPDDRMKRYDNLFFDGCPIG